MTDEEKRNVETVMHWVQFYNAPDLVRFVYECYTPDCVAYAMGNVELDGSEIFLEAERQVLAAAPKRYMRLDHLTANGNNMTVECTLLDPDRGDDFAIPWVAVFTMRDGKIAIDRTYAEWTKWPGVSDFSHHKWGANTDHCVVCRSAKFDPPD
jgi:ketosteroid isomerase-like protein